MKKYKLYYAELNNHDDIPCIEFDSEDELIEEVIGYILEPIDIVWVLAWDGEVFVSNESLIIENILGSAYFEEKEVHIQEYSSYEEAYKIALAMKEPNPLCYKN